jgi:hypothetical protein
MTSDIPYEAEMSIIYGPVTKGVVVSFRGKCTFLGPFPDRNAAIAAAERFCRENGWGK